MKQKCKIECATLQDVPAMLEYENKYFDPCWHADPAQVKELITRDPMMFRLCKLDDTLKGYYGVMALPKPIFNKLLNGEIHEQEALEHTLPFDTPELCLYIFSLIVDMADTRHKLYTRTLMRDFTRQFVLSEGEKKTDTKLIGAFTVSKGGQKIVERTGFDYIGSFRGDNGQKVNSYTIPREKLGQYVLQVREECRNRPVAEN